MRFPKFVVTALLVGAASTAALVSNPARAAESSGDAFTVDPVHSMVVFRVGHMGVSYVYGMIWKPTGSYTLDFENAENSSLKIELHTENIDTGDERRDKHLSSPDFFNSKQYPTLTFEATSFESIGEGIMTVEGNLTMLGETKPTTATLQFIDEADTRQGHKSGFECTFTIKRSDFGMTAFLEGNGLGDEISLFVTVEGVLAE